MHAASTLCGNASAASDAANGSSCYLLDPSCDPQAHFFADAQYNRYRPPSVYTDAEGEPTVVYFQLFIQSAFYACPVNQELYFASQMEYSWLDARLNLSLLVDGQRTSPLPEGLSDRLWRPRLAFSPVTKLSPLDSQADRRLRFRVAPDNRIVASQRLNFALCCNIDYIYYPFDVHVCDMSIVNSGRRTRLVVRAAFRRQLLAVLIDPLGPSLFPVLLSWTGFWLDPKRPVTRAALMALSFVILEHQQVSHFTSRAQDHQLRSIDVWYLICRCFIMAALLEYVLILHTADNLQDCSVPPSPPRGATSGVDVSSPASMATTAGGCGSSQAKLATSSATSPATSATAAGLARVVRLSPQETDDACKTFFPLAFLLASLLYAGAFAGPLLTSKDFAKLPVRYAE
ncbi:glycine receptor subunit alpha-2 isoform X2 [Rhipicephalus sanguineus]|uniref:glycine receptor subunit alpha-2 isoform X2 n=1 Tax=Rhipicephalus sanguineus TaxID=34632 RepID=UPI0020C42511|nr:glycine receptor subunit alpha-2 isoform X2 [Rhipicephalus sanguineus]